MPKNVIFDLGNVILHFDWKEYLNSFTKDKTEQDFIEKYIYYSPEWYNGSLADLGYMTREDSIQAQMERSNHKNDELLLRFWNDFLNAYIINDKVMELIKKIKSQGYKIYLLSNLSEDAYEHLADHELFKILDGAIFSYKVHKIKPNDAIYHELETQYGIKFEESIFIDNNQDNVDTGNRLGLKSIKVNDNDYEDLANKISKYI